MILKKDFKTRSLELFKKLGWNPIDKICIAKRPNLFKKITENKAPEYLINKLAKFKSETNYNSRSTLAYRLPKQRTSSLRRNFFLQIFEKVEGFRNENKTYYTRTNCSSATENRCVCVLVPDKYPTRFFVGDRNLACLISKRRPINCRLVCCRARQIVGRRTWFNQ